MTTDEQLRVLLAENAIKNVQLRYCRGIDRFDWDLIEGCFHPDAIHDLGPFKGTVAEFVPWASKLLPQYESTTHLSGGQTVLQISGDTAWAEHYVRAYHRTAPSATEPATEWIINLRYIDRMSCRNDEWRIAHRQCVCESQRIDVLDSAGAELGPEWARGRRDHTDPSHRRD
jgi:hypothetical protein